MSGHTAASGSDASDEPTAVSTCSSGQEDSGANANGTQHFQQWRRRQRCQRRHSVLSALEKTTSTPTTTLSTFVGGEDGSDTNGDTTTLSACSSRKDNSHTNANDTQHFQHVEMTTAMPTTTTLGTFSSGEDDSDANDDTQHLQQLRRRQRCQCQRHSAFSASEKRKVTPTTTLSYFQQWRREKRHQRRHDTQRLQ